MKDPLNRTKVVLRHLPPSISQPALMEQIDGRFSGRYKWFSFRPGKNSQKNQRHSRAYIEFQSPEDVVDFAEFFDGHIFVNEKGSQFKALVEYAPSQRVPKVGTKKDGREGTILKDPEYLEFLELIAKPVENLPSAEVQLERREAERAGGSKDAVIVTPLMDFIRQKRAAKSGSQRSSANEKLSRRAGGAASSTSSSSRRGSEKRRGAASVYVLRDNTKASGRGKDKSMYMLLPRKEDQQLGASNTTEVSEDETATGTNGTNTPGSVDIGKRKVILLKGKEREASNVSSGSSRQSATVSVRNFTGPIPLRQNQRHEASGRTIRSILSNKDARQSQSDLAGVQSEHQPQAVSSDRDKRLSRPPNPRLLLKDHFSSIANTDGQRSIDDKIATKDPHTAVPTGDKNERRMRNKDRPDRGVWAPRRSDRVHVSDDSSLSSHMLSDSLENISLSQQIVGHKDGDGEMSFQGAHGGRGSNSSSAYGSLGQREPKTDLPIQNRNPEIKILLSGSGRINASSAENGVHNRALGRRAPAHGMKEVDGLHPEGKSSKRGSSAGYGSHEKQVWVQKSGSGS